MNSFDVGIVLYVNQLAHRWFALDATVSLIASDSLIKGGVIVALLWWAWFRASEKRAIDREFLSCGIVTAFLSLLVARTLAELLPYRERPLHTPALHFQMPYHSNESILIHWSSFPSDHAALFCALSLSIYFVSRRVGLAALCYTLVVICLPRIYMGFHYPSDIIAGGLIGAGSAALSQITAFRQSVGHAASRWVERSPGVFYAGFFLVTFQIAVTFDPLRQIVRYLIEMVKVVSGQPS